MDEPLMKVRDAARAISDHIEEFGADVGGTLGEDLDALDTAVSRLAVVLLQHPYDSASNSSTELRKRHEQNSRDNA